MARATREDRTMADETIHWFAGVDWGSAKHQVCLLDGAGNVVGEREFAHGGAGLTALCEWVVSMAGDPARLRWRSRCRMGRWWMPCWTAALPCTRSIPSSSTACATASALPGPRTTGAMPGLQRLGCAQIGLYSAACWPVTQAWLSSASGR